MAFKGTLKEFKVPDILQLISLQKKTGILTFTSTEGFITLIFDRGMIVGVDSFPKKLEMRVGSVLVKQDYISEDMLQRALSIQKRTNQKIGEILLGMGLIGEETIRESLVTQAIEIVLSLFKWKKGDYNFKIMEVLDDGMQIIPPLATDNLIMEGVQMLDEWPIIKQHVPDDTIVFEPVPVDSHNIEIIGEYEDAPSDDERIYLTETETNLLKYINSENTVRDLVDLGFFTEYKVYKSLYNLVRKRIIRAKTQATPDETGEQEELDDTMANSRQKVMVLYGILTFLLMIMWVLTLFKPLSPFKSENMLLKDSLYKEEVLLEKVSQSPPSKQPENKE